MKFGQVVADDAVGTGGDLHGGPDPTSGHTGANVYGFELAGDYANNRVVSLLEGGYDLKGLAFSTAAHWSGVTL